MRKIRVILWVVALVLAGLVTSLFVVQNLGRTTDLSLDVYFAAWHLARPVPVPWLILGTLAAGLLLGLLAGALLRRPKRTETRTRAPEDAWT